MRKLINLRSIRTARTVLSSFHIVIINSNDQWCSVQKSRPMCTYIYQASLNIFIVYPAQRRQLTSDVQFPRVQRVSGAPQWWDRSGGRVCAAVPGLWLFWIWAGRTRPGWGIVCPRRGCVRSSLATESTVLSCQRRAPPSHPGKWWRRCSIPCPAWIPTPRPRTAEATTRPLSGRACTDPLSPGTVAGEDNLEKVGEKSSS